MRLNPELQRYIWLEFSLQRLIVMPVVIAIIFYISAQKIYPIEALLSSSLFIYLILLGVWGGNKAAASVIDEANENTWDFQKLSSLSPSSLTFGKLFGSTLYCWYGALIALSVYIYSAMTIIPIDYVFCNVIILICSALICHAAALIASLQAIQAKAALRRKIQALGAHIVGLGLGSLFLSGIAYKDFDYIPRISWHGQDYIYNQFVTFFAVITLLWLVAGVYWLMRGQLRMRTGPWLWIAFTVYMMFFLAGFNWQTSMFYSLDSGLLVAYGVGIFFLYSMAFTESWNGLLYRRLLDNWKIRNIKNFMNLFPRWLATLIVTFILTIIVVISYAATPMVALSVLVAFCFVIRDIALLHYFKLSPESKRATTATLFYLLILYVLIPTLLGVTHSPNAIALFLLVPKDGIIVTSFISATLQSVLFIFLAWSRWKKYWQ